MNICGTFAFRGVGLELSGNELAHTSRCVFELFGSLSESLLLFCVTFKSSLSSHLLPLVEPPHITPPSTLDPHVSMAASSTTRELPLHLIAC